MKTGLLYSALLLLTFHVPLSAQSPLTDNRLKSHLDSVVHQAATLYLSQPNTAGISIGIISKGQPYTYHYGEVKKGSHQLPTAATYYNLGSVAKTFVGALLAQAVIDKKVKLTDDIRQYLPGSYPNLTYQGRPIQLVHLANHTSALPRSAKTYPASTKDSLAKLDLVSLVNFYGRYNQDSLLRDLHTYRLDTIPGTRYQYNGHGVMVLLLVLERIYGQPYQQLYTAYLQGHLNMGATKVELSATDLKQVAQGYNKTGQPQPYVNAKGFYVGASMNSTLGDMLKYVQANLKEQDPALKLSHQLTWGNPNGTGMGLCWMLDKRAPLGLHLYHSGSTGLGFNTLCSMYPERNTGIIILVNDTTSQDRLADLELAILQAIQPDL